MISFFINRVIAWASGLTAKDFLKLRSWVELAEASGFRTGSEKSKFVLLRAKTVWAKLFHDDGQPKWAMQLILNLAVGLLKKK